MRSGFINTSFSVSIVDHADRLVFINQNSQTSCQHVPLLPFLLIIEKLVIIMHNQRVKLVLTQERGDRLYILL